jgi:hypothetical protein
MKDKKKDIEKETEQPPTETVDQPAPPEAETRKDIRIVTDLESMVHGFDDDVWSAGS